MKDQPDLQPSALAPLPGGLCPRCAAGKLDYNGLFRLRSMRHQGAIDHIGRMRARCQSAATAASSRRTKPLAAVPSGPGRFEPLS